MSLRVNAALAFTLSSSTVLAGKVFLVQREEKVVAFRPQRQAGSPSAAR